MSLAAEPAAFEVRGELQLQLQGHIAHGWCQSPQSPGTSLTIELLSEGRVIARALARRLYMPLVRPGISDGYHGFSIPILEQDATNHLLEAREVESGQVFARILPPVMADIAGWAVEAAALDHRLGAVAAKLVAAGTGPAPMQAALAKAGRMLAPTRAPDFALRPAAAPRLSIILDLPQATGISAAHAALRCFAPLLGMLGAELIAIGDSEHRAALSSIPGLRLSPGDESVAASRLNRAIAAARAPVIACFTPLPGISPLHCARRLNVEDEEIILLGGGVARAVRGAGLDALAAAITPVEIPTGLLLRAPRAAFDTIGPLDPVFEDGADLPLAAWALAAKTDSLCILDEPPHRRARRQDQAAVQAARSRFRAAFGRSAG